MKVTAVNTTRFVLMTNEDSYQTLDLTALLLTEELQIRFEQDACWSSQPIWTLERKNIFYPSRELGSKAPVLLSLYQLKYSAQNL